MSATMFAAIFFACLATFMVHQYLLEYGDPEVAFTQMKHDLLGLSDSASVDILAPVFNIPGFVYHLILDLYTTPVTKVDHCLFGVLTSHAVVLLDALMHIGLYHLLFGFPAVNPSGFSH
ncbi:hypothetical protein OQA88_1534 [Cercophora sp. LCS_1]